MEFFGEGLIVKDLKPESMEVTVAYRPRPQFLPFHSRAERFARIVTHRRAGNEKWSIFPPPNSGELALILLLFG